jgi:hypothetical protein
MPNSTTSALILFAALLYASVRANAASDVGAAEGRLLGQVGESKDRVYWTCRLDACRVSIAFTDRDLRATNAEGVGTRIKVGPPTQAWLLKADGSHIPALRQVPTNIGATNFEFPLSAEEEAFAVVVRIADKLHTWWLAAGIPPAK